MAHLHPTFTQIFNAFDKYDMKTEEIMSAECATCEHRYAVHSGGSSGQCTYNLECPCPRFTASSLVIAAFMLKASEEPTK
jgi:hypothetical protein